LGKVALIVSGPQRQDLEESDSPARATAAVKEALNRLPGTSVLDAEPAKRWDKALGDREAVAAGKARGAQSVCVVNVSDYDGLFMVGIWWLGPMWECKSRVAYSMRLLDVESGELLAESVRYRQMGGMYEICDPSDKEGSLKRLLKVDLAVEKGKS
jgi:hypothetical protein